MSILSLTEFRQLFDPDRISQLSSDSSARFGTILPSSTIVQAVIDQAEGVVKNTLSLQYTTSDLEADAGVKRIVADLAMYYLESRRPPPLAETARLHKLALTLLRQLQLGEAKLAVVDQLLPTGPTDEPTEATDSGYFD